MNKETQPNAQSLGNDMAQTGNDVGHDMCQLAKDAKALLEATADAAGEKVKQARERLASALEHAKEMGDSWGKQAAAGAKVADEMVHKNPYPAIAIAVGMGAIIGLLIARR